MNETWNYLESKKLQRQKRRRVWGGFLLIVIIALLLLLMRCEDPHSIALEPIGSLSKNKVSEQIPLRSAPQRSNFANSLGERAPWTVELVRELQKRKKGVKSCFPLASSYAFSWNFSYQIESGRLLDQGFTWIGLEPDEETKTCISDVLSASYRVSVQSNNTAHWFNLSIQYSDDPISQ